MSRVAVIEELCKGCNVCIELCPKDLLRESKKLNVKGIFPPTLIDQDQCTGCGICELYCPDFAMYVVREADQ